MVAAHPGKFPPTNPASSKVAQTLHKRCRTIAPGARVAPLSTHTGRCWPTNECQKSAEFDQIRPTLAKSGRSCRQLAKFDQTRQSLVKVFIGFGQTRPILADVGQLLASFGRASLSRNLQTLDAQAFLANTGHVLLKLGANFGSRGNCSKTCETPQLAKFAGGRSLSGMCGAQVFHIIWRT